MTDKKDKISLKKSLDTSVRSYWKEIGVKNQLELRKAGASDVKVGEREKQLKQYDKKQEEENKLTLGTTETQSEECRGDLWNRSDTLLLFNRANGAKHIDWESITKELGNRHSIKECEEWLSVLSDLADLKERAPKRKRRKRDDIVRTYTCTVRDCERAYGSEGALKHHFKLKHPKLTYIPQKRGSDPSRRKRSSKRSRPLSYSTPSQIDVNVTPAESSTTDSPHIAHLDSPVSSPSIQQYCSLDSDGSSLMVSPRNNQNYPMSSDEAPNAVQNQFISMVDEPLRFDSTHIGIPSSLAAHFTQSSVYPPTQSAYNTTMPFNFHSYSKPKPKMLKHETMPVSEEGKKNFYGTTCVPDPYNPCYPFVPNGIEAFSPDKNMQFNNKYYYLLFPF
eukprot:TRINITY_DN1087_c0_g1_i3.p1 TRINITY_DN1087_c0_g1~~TRINITY_DN1087_c0_g1_i3.p1  ORF type:complete len:391 (+),score=68.05 TRINITY_DN1087_c0_g1_i3:45-1217(+)